MKGDMDMPKFFRDLYEVNGERIVDVKPTDEINSDGILETYYIVKTWVTEYLYTELGEYLGELG